MKNRLEFIFTASALLFLLMASVAPASYTRLNLYWDGAEVNEINAPDVLEFTKDYLWVGTEGNTGYMYNEYVGAMDEFAIYGKVLPLSRIQAHYAAKDSYSNYTSAVDADNPLMWLRFEDSSLAHGAAAANSGSSVTDGEYFKIETVPDFNQVAGINADSNALDFVGPVGDGAPGKAVYIPDNGEFSSGLEGVLTVEFWVKWPTWSSDWARFFSYGNTNFFQGGNPGEFVFQAGGGYNGINLLGGEDGNDGQWHHVVCTMESVPEPRIPKDTNSYVQEVNENNPVVWVRFEDEENPSDSAGDDDWVGYGSALDIVEQVGGIGNSGLLNGLSGDGVYGAAVAGGPNSPPMDPNEAIGYEVFGDQYAIVPNDITIEMWYKTIPDDPSMEPDEFGWFFQQHGAYTNEDVAPAVGNGGGSFRISDGNNLWYTGVGTKFDGEWHHLVVTYDEDYNNVPNNLNVQLYVDGLLRAEELATETTHSFLGPELSHMMIGAENDIGNTYNIFKGYVDEFAIYEGVLDANSIEDHYWAWTPKNCDELWSRGGPDEQALKNADIDKDCQVNFTDFALFAQQWAYCNDPTIGPPECPANW